MIRLAPGTRIHVDDPTLKNPSWLSDLQPSAPLEGYLMENGEFSASLSKDGRLTEGLKLTIEATDV